MAPPGHLDVPVIGASDVFDVVVAKLARYVSPAPSCATPEHTPTRSYVIEPQNGRELIL